MADLPQLSRYTDEALRRFPELLAQLSHPAQPPQIDQTDFMPALRRYRQQRSVAILWDDLSGACDVAQTCQAISTLAGECLELALAEAEQQLRAVHGELLDANGQAIRLSILGLGKLGGQELNFNSDIDVVFNHQGNGQSTGRRALAAGDYLSRVARRLIETIDTVTDAGRVWVVDTRLRPFGSAGALVWSNSAMETYFLNEGRTWERYAWLKARSVAGDQQAGQALLQALQPFIFRRYLDYGIFDSLRDLHQRIDANSRQDARDDIKRGPGGIRELEFLVQSLQILRGGREPSLQQAGFLPALAACQQQQLIDTLDGDALREAYLFLRLLENRLQAMTGRQQHHLPNQAEDQARLATLMAVKNWSALTDELNHHRHLVQQHFQRHFAQQASPPRQAHMQWPPTAQCQTQLQQLGHSPTDSEAVAEQLHGLADRLGRRPLSSEARRRLEALMPRLIEQVLKHAKPQQGLAALCGLIEHTVQRSAYLALLVERPDVLKRVIDVYRRSPPLAEWISAAPQLLDDVLAPTAQATVPSPKPDTGDIEQSLAALSHWRRAQTVRLGLACLDGRRSAEQTGADLTAVAETCLNAALQWLDPEQRQRIAIIGYGNLGAAQMHYDSDLDLVFLHDQDQAPLKLVQRLISWMQLPLPGGRLFEIDTRLRPNGRAGLLVSTLQQFERYQREVGWTWEHQALIRARCVAGSSDLVSAFEAIRGQVLTQPRDRDATTAALRDMRLKQRQGRQESALTACMTDLQALAECGVLCHAPQHPDLIQFRRTADQLRALGNHQLMPLAQADALAQCWQRLMAQRHQHWLSGDREDAIVAEQDVTLIAQAWPELQS